jgi:hypothetical protein
MKHIETDILELRTKIKQLDEELCEVEENIESAEQHEEENTQVLHRQYLELEYMSEDCKGDRKLLQLISQKHDVLLDIKKAQSRLLEELHCKRKETAKNTKFKIEDLENQISELERRAHNDE